MNHFKSFYSLIIILFLGLASSLPALSNGLYVLNYTKSTSFPEMEAQFQAMGLDIKQKSIETYTEIVIEVNDNCFLDPVELLTFSIDRAGVVSCLSNPTITGLFNKKTGEFSWTGYIAHSQLLKYAKSSGQLEKISRKSKAEMENTLIYQLENNQGDLLTASFQDGFLLLQKTNNEKSSYQGWPTRVNPDGTFKSTIGMVTEVITGQTDAPPLVQALQNTTLVTEGKINKDGSIEITFYDDFAQIQDRQNKPKTSYSGRVLNTQELALRGQNPYENFKIELEADEVEFRTAQNNPDWYVNPPSDDSFLYAAGSRCLPEKEHALKMAETIAASVLASQINVRIQSEILEKNGQIEDSVQIKITETAEEELNYEVQESLYDEENQTAYILIRIEKENI